jgi:hypothetical protein
VSDSAENWASTILSISVRILVIGKFTRVQWKCNIRFYHRPDDGDSLHNFWQDVSAPAWNRTSTVCVYIFIYTHIYGVCVCICKYTHTIYILCRYSTHTHMCIYLYPGSLPWGIMLPLPKQTGLLKCTSRLHSQRFLRNRYWWAPCTVLKQHRWRCNLGNSWKLNNTPTMYSIWGWFLQVFTTHKMVITWEWFTIGFTTCYISYFKLLMLTECIYIHIWHYLAMESQHGTPVWTHTRFVTFRI